MLYFDFFFPPLLLFKRIPLVNLVTTSVSLQFIASSPDGGMTQHVKLHHFHGLPSHARAWGDLPQVLELGDEEKAAHVSAPQS